MCNQNVSDIGGKIFSAKQTPIELVKTYENAIKKIDREIKNTEERAQEAKEKADEANNMSAGFFQKKHSIEGLQDAVASQSDVNEQIIKLNRAQSLSVQKLAQISKATVAVSSTNLAYARQVQQELIAMLKKKNLNPSEKNDILEKNIRDTLTQISQTVDILSQQEMQGKEIKKSKNDISSLKRADLDISDRVNKQFEDNVFQDEKISQIENKNDMQDANDRRHDKALDEIQKINNIQDENDKRHDEALKKIERLDDIQNRILNEQKETDKRHDEMLKQISSINDQQDKILNDYKKIDDDNFDKISKLSDQLSIANESINDNKKTILSMEKSFKKRNNISIICGVLIVLAIILSFIF